ncbi:MAG: hypothetical protein C4331_01135, partial [Meiothermus sp.]
RLIVLSVFLALLSGCALLFKGDSQVVPLNSDPSGAEVFLDGQRIGVTPVQIPLKTNKSYTLTFRKDGQERTVILQNQIGALWVVLDVVSGLVPLIIDAATGAWYKLNPGQVNVVLK